MPYSLTFELYGSNEEGRRPKTWSLPPTAVEGLSPGDDAESIAKAAAAAGRRQLLAGVGCLAMFNPDTVASYRTVVAGCAPPQPYCRSLQSYARHLLCLV